MTQTSILLRLNCILRIAGPKKVSIELNVHATFPHCVPPTTSSVGYSFCKAQLSCLATSCAKVSIYDTNVNITKIELHTQNRRPQEGFNRTECTCSVSALRSSHHIKRKVFSVRLSPDRLSFLFLLADNRIESQCPPAPEIAISDGQSRRKRSRRGETGTWLPPK